MLKDTRDKRQKQKKEFKAIKVPKEDKLVVRFNNKVIEKVLYAKSTKVIKRRCECKLRQQNIFRNQKEMA